MEKKKSVNEILLRPLLNKPRYKTKIEKKRINHVKNVFLTKTFASKLFIKLCREVIDPIIICLQTLKYEPENRKQEEIESTIPYLKTLENFNDYVNFLETPNSAFDLMTKFAKITFYQYYRRNSIIKKPGETNETFFILLNGNVFEYNLIFEAENLSLEQYLLYLIKLELINEKEIINRCNLLNKEIIDIDRGISGSFSVEKLVQRSNKFNYHEMQLKAQKELFKLGFNSHLYKQGNLKLAPNIENYLKIFDELGKSSNNEGKNKFHFYVGKYKLSTKLFKGQFFNNISNYNLKENNLYICETNCDLGQIKRDEFIRTELNKSINKKMRKLFSKVKNNYFFLKGIDDQKFLDEYSNFFLYKKYKKNDKIILQGGYYNGMYLILEGNISITTSSCIDKLCNLLFTIINSIKSFSEYIPSFNSENLINDFNNMHQKLYKNIRLTHEEYIFKRIIDISVQKKFDVLGFYDLIDNKTDLYNFTAECISESAILLFIPRNNLSLILCKELNFYTSLISLVENKIQFVVGKFKSFIYQIMANYKMTLRKSVSNSKMEYSQDKNNKNYDITNKNIRKIFTQNSKRFSMNNNTISNKLNDSEKKNDTIYNYANMKSYKYYESINNFRKELKRKKKIAEEILANKKNFLFFQSSYNDFYKPKKKILNSIDTKLLNTNFFATFGNKMIHKGKKQNNYKSVDFSSQVQNLNNNYFSLTTIGVNNNNNNNDNKLNYETEIRNYQPFPMINYQRTRFIYK